MTQDQREFVRSIVGVAIGVIVLIICIALSGCATSRVATDIHEQSYAHDSTRVQTVYVYDTTHIYDTAHVTVTESEHSTDRTEIVFATDGGTYDAHTGVATGVVSVNTSSELQSYKQANATLLHEITEVSMERDSLADMVAEMLTERDQTQTVVQTQTKFERFCIVWFWMTVAAVVASIAIWLFRKFYLKK